MPAIVASLRLVVVTMLVCVAGYATVIWVVGQVFSRETAEGSFIVDGDGRVIGSRLIAQPFTEPRYFWPRPSAVDYNAAGAGGSNKSPTSADLTERAREVIARHEASPENPLPAELAAASGGGLDPHITEAAAVYQAARVAEARGLPQADIEAIIGELAYAPGGFLTRDRLVNVLELNLALDARASARRAATRATVVEGDG